MVFFSVILIFLLEAIAFLAIMSYDLHETPGRQGANQG